MLIAATRRRACRRPRLVVRPGRLIHVGSRALWNGCIVLSARLGNHSSRSGSLRHDGLWRKTEPKLDCSAYYVIGSSHAQLHAQTASNFVAALFFTTTTFSHIDTKTSFFCSAYVNSDWSHSIEDCNGHMGEIFFFKSQLIARKSLVYDIPLSCTVAL